MAIEDLYKDVSGDVEVGFDTNIFPKDYPSDSPTGYNMKVAGMIVDEACGKINEEFVGLRVKLYGHNMFVGRPDLRPGSEMGLCGPKEEKRYMGLRRLS